MLINTCNTRPPSSRSFSFLAPFFILDQLLLPMGHIFSIPFKLSYAILPIWALMFLLNSCQNNNIKLRQMHAEILNFALPFIALSFLLIFSSLFFLKEYSVVSNLESYRIAFLFLICIAAYGFGGYAAHFNLKYILYILYAYAVITILFSECSSSFPWIAHFYYTKNTLVLVQSFANSRPRGLFFNPNVSMLIYSVLLLALTVAYRKGYVAFNQTIHFPLLIFFTLSLLVLLQSKNQAVLCFLILSYHLYTISKERNVFSPGIKILGVLLILLASFYFLKLYHNGTLLHAFLDRFSKISIHHSGSSMTQSLFRPFFTLHYFWSRFSLSPFLGSGFSVLNTHDPYLAYPPKYYHNDVFFMLVGTGIFGFAIYLFIIVKFCAKVSALFILPFIFPGLTNTFIQIIPVVLFYFFIIGNFSQRMKKR